MRRRSPAWSASRACWCRRGPGINCAIGLLQTAVTPHLPRLGGRAARGLSGRADQRAVRRARAQARADAQADGFARDALRLRHQVEMRYPQQGYQLAVDCPFPFGDADKAPLKRAFDALHRQTYGQAAEAEDAEIVTFRLQAEIEVPRYEIAGARRPATAMRRARSPASASCSTSLRGGFVTATALRPRQARGPATRSPGRRSSTSSTPPRSCWPGRRCASIPRHAGDRHGGGRMSIDPITIEVVTSRLREIAAGMEHALYHAGFSPILRESRDGTAGLTDAQGRVLMVGGGLQYHSLPYEQAVRAVVAQFGDAHPRRRQLHRQRSVRGGQSARARPGGGDAGVPRRRADRLRREHRAQGGHGRPGARLVGGRLARDLPRRPAPAAGALPDRRRESSAPSRTCCAPTAARPTW